MNHLTLYFGGGVLCLAAVVALRSWHASRSLWRDLKLLSAENDRLRRELAESRPTGSHG